MKVITGCFTPDILELSWLDLWSLVLGKDIELDSFEVLRRRPLKTILGRR